MKPQGRRKPYTETGIKRLNCFRCPNKANQQWQICADGNVYRPICIDCDIALNEMVLKWMGFTNWQEKIQIYKEELIK